MPLKFDIATIQVCYVYIAQSHDYTIPAVAFFVFVITFNTWTPWHFQHAESITEPESYFNSYTYSSPAHYSECLCRGLLSGGLEGFRAPGVDVLFQTF